MENQKRTGGETSGVAVTGGQPSEGRSGRGGGEGSGAEACLGVWKKSAGTKRRGIKEERDGKESLGGWWLEDF